MVQYAANGLGATIVPRPFTGKRSDGVDPVPTFHILELTGSALSFTIGAFKKAARHSPSTGAIHAMLLAETLHVGQLPTNKRDQAVAAANRWSSVGIGRPLRHGCEDRFGVRVLLDGAAVAVCVTAWLLVPEEGAGLSIGRRCPRSLASTELVHS